MATAKQFLDAIELQKLVPTDDLDELYKEYRSSGGAVTAESLADKLVKKGAITREKADTLLASSTSDSFIQVTAASLSSGSMISSSGVLSSSSVNLGAGESSAGSGDPFDDELEAKKSSAGIKRDAAGRRKHVQKKHKNDFDSPLLLIGGGILALLVLGGGGLALLMNLQSGDQLIESAKEAYESGSYPQARDQYETFVEDFTGHTRWAEARVALAVVKLRQLTDTSGDWSRALDVAQEEVPQVANEREAFADRWGEFASMLPRIARGLAERADSKSETSDGTDSALESEIDGLVGEAQEALTLVGNTKYVPKQLRDDGEVAAIEELLDRVERRREANADLATTLAAIEAATAAEDISEAYTLHTDFVGRRPELRDDERLAQKLAAAVEAERLTVRFVEDTAAATTETRPTPVSLALPLASPRREGSSGAAGVFYSPFRGVLYAVDAGSGALLWRLPVGERLDEVQPTPVGDDLLVVDHTHGDLLRVIKKTGELVWRVAIESPGGASALHTPVLAGDRVLIASESGRLWSVGVEDGGRYGYAQFAQPLRSAPAVDEETGKAYLLGQQSSGYTLDAESLECVAVAYTGHAKGAAPVPPLAIDGRVLMLRNTIIEGSEVGTTSVLAVYATDSDGVLTNQVAEWRHEGIVTTPARLAERSVMVATDRGAVYLYEVNSATDGKPLSLTATRAPQPDASGRLLVAGGGGSVWIASTGLQRTAASLADSQLVVRTVANPCDGDRFLGRLETRGAVVLHTRVREGRAGVTFAASDAKSGRLVWETDLAPLPLGPPVVSSRPRGVLATVASGETHLIGPESIRAGLSAKPAVSTRVDEQYKASVNLPGGVGVVAKLGAVEWFATALSPRAGSRRTNLPGELACTPTEIAGAVIAPIRVGQVHLLDAAGRERATPFQPEVAVGEPINWTPAAAGRVDGRRIVVLSDGGETLYSLEVKTAGDPALVKLAEHRLRDGAPMTRSAIAGSHAAIGLTGGRIVVAPALTFASPATATLSGAIAAGPYAAGDLFLAADESGTLSAIDSAAQIRWRLDLAGDRLAGEPLAADDGIVVVTEGGKLRRIDPASGQIAGEADLGQRAGSGATAYGSRLLVSAADGSVLVINKP